MIENIDLLEEKIWCRNIYRTWIENHLPVRRENLSRIMIEKPTNGVDKILTF